MQVVSHPSSVMPDRFAPDMLTTTRFAWSAALKKKHLFTTDVDTEALWLAYLDNLPPQSRQEHNCNCCKAFIRNVGGLVIIDENGVASPVLWGKQEGMYAESAAAMAALVRKAKVNGVFLSSDAEIGRNHNVGPNGVTWTHLSINDVPVTRKASEVAAAKKEEFGMLARGLAEFKRDTFAQAETMLGSDALPRAEKHKGLAKWLRELVDARAATKRPDVKCNLLWLAVASAPPGWCHVRSGLIGTLLEDIEAGMDHGAVAKRFTAKIDPLAYMRPQAAPSDGQIAAAEKLCEELGFASALRRRKATLDDIGEWLWKPTDAAPPKVGGVFAHLREPTDKPTSVGISSSMSWAKFARDILPNAKTMRITTPAYAVYVGLHAAADPTSRPILQWDREEQRNTVSQYVWAGGSSREQWGLRSSTAPVVGICPMPAHWHGSKLDHHIKGAVFLIEGCDDSRSIRPCLFPETLRSELHPIRSVIEAHCKKADLEPHNGTVAAGLYVSGSMGVEVVVTLANGTSQTVKIDRWE